MRHRKLKISRINMDEPSDAMYAVKITNDYCKLLFGDQSIECKIRPTNNRYHSCYAESGLTAKLHHNVDPVEGLTLSVSIKVDGEIYARPLRNGEVYWFTERALDKVFQFYQVLERSKDGCFTMTRRRKISSFSEIKRKFRIK